jgi:uncharacterized protein with HEPN domain
MKKDPRIYLDDILFSIDLIQQYIVDVSFSSFDNSYDIQDKVLRRLEIIAEAAKKLPEEIRTKHQSVPWKSIIGLRNIITHTYDDVNLEEIWEIVTKHLPETKKQIEQIRQELDPEINSG